MRKTISNENFLVGNEVMFGRYMQDADSDAMTDIQWIVLAREENKALLSSKYGLDAKPYHSEFKNITWEDCDLRQWLNTDFLNTAFTKEEQETILVTKVNNDWRQGFRDYDVNGENNTEDKIFLLSHKEAFEEYFVDAISRTSNPTAYAENKDPFVSRKGKCWWWLRSPGITRSYAGCVSSDGFHCNRDVRSNRNCVRPAIWVSLDPKV